jgi:hypothetical protein
VGCGRATEDHDVVSRAEWEALPQTCDEVLRLAGDDDAVGVSAAEGLADSVVLDTPDGSCVDTGAHLSEALAADERFNLLERVHAVLVGPAAFLGFVVNGDGVSADPFPHPDRNADLNDGDDHADPFPHPDRNKDDDDDDGAVVIVIVITVGGEGTGPVPGGTPPASPTSPATPTSGGSDLD